MDNGESDLANAYRHMDPGHFTGLQDDEVLGVAKQLDPKYSERYRAVLAPKTGDTVAGLVSGDTGPLAKAQGSETTLGTAMAGLNKMAAAVPGASPLGAAGKYLTDKAQETYQPVVDAVNKKLAADGGGSYNPFLQPKTAMPALGVPQDALGGLLTVLGGAGEALGAAKGVLSGLGGSGGQLLEKGLASAEAAKGIRAATGLPHVDIEYLLTHPEGADKVFEKAAAIGGTEGAGKIINDVAARYGVATGKDALLRSGMGLKTPPTYGNASSFVQDTYRNLDHARDLVDANAALETMKDVKLPRGDESQILQHWRSELSDATDELHKREQWGNTSNANLDDVRQRVKTASAGLEEATKQMPSEAAMLKDYLTKKKSMLEASQPPSLQDMIASRQILAKQMQRPMYAQPAESQTIMPAIGHHQLNDFDNAISHVTDSMGPIEPVDAGPYGKITSYSQLNASGMYRDAKIAEKLSTLTPSNANGSAAVIRMLAAFAMGGAKGAGALAGESPLVWGNLLKLSSKLKRGAEAAGTASSGAGLAAGAATGAVNSAEKSDETSK